MNLVVWDIIASILIIFYVISVILVLISLTHCALVVTLTDIGSGNGFLCYDTKPSTEPILTSWTDFILYGKICRPHWTGHVHHPNLNSDMVGILFLKWAINLPRDQWVNNIVFPVIIVHVYMLTPSCPSCAHPRTCQLLLTRYGLVVT